jgi:hypothetical protein
MFKTLTQNQSKEKKVSNEVLETLNVVDIDLRLVKTNEATNMALDQVSVIYKYFTLAPYNRLEVVLIEESENQKRLYVLERKASKGFRMLEIEREVITILMDNDCDI